MPRGAAVAAVVSVFVAICLICPVAVGADASMVPLSPAFTIGPKEGTAHQPVVIYGPDACEYLVVWSSVTQGETGEDVWGQRVSWEGDLLGDPVAICDSVGDQLLPDVAYSSLAHEYLVVWQDHRTVEGSGADVYARRVGTQGDLIGSELSITAAGGDQSRPRIAYSAIAEQYLIVWQDSEAGGDESDIFGRWLVADGGWAGDEFSICDATGGQSVPDVVADQSRRQCLVVWEDGRHAAWKHQDIYARFVIPGAAEDSPEIKVASALAPEYSPRVAYNAVLDEYLVLWEDEIGGRRLSGEGEPIGPSFALFRASPYLRRPALLANADSGDWVVVWEDRCEDGAPHTDLFVRCLRASGREGEDGSALCDLESNQFSPSIAANVRRGEVMAVWSDDVGGDGSLVIRGRRYMLSS